MLLQLLMQCRWLPAFERPSAEKCLPSSALGIGGSEPSGNGSKMHIIFIRVCFRKNLGNAEK